MIMIIIISITTRPARHQSWTFWLCTGKHWTNVGIFHEIYVNKYIKIILLFEQKCEQGHFIRYAVLLAQVTYLQNQHNINISGIPPLHIAGVMFCLDWIFPICLPAVFSFWSKRRLDFVFDKIQSEIKLDGQ